MSKVDQFRNVLTDRINACLERREDPRNAMNGTAWHTAEQALYHAYTDLIVEYDDIHEGRNAVKNVYKS